MKLFNQVSTRFLPHSSVDPSLSELAQLDAVQASLREVLGFDIARVAAWGGERPGDIVPQLGAIFDGWFNYGRVRYVPTYWIKLVLTWCEEPTHYNMTLEDYLAALRGIEAGDENFFELLPCYRGAFEALQSSVGNR